MLDTYIVLLLMPEKLRKNVILLSDDVRVLELEFYLAKDTPLASAGMDLGDILKLHRFILSRVSYRHLPNLTSAS